MKWSLRAELLEGEKKLITSLSSISLPGIWIA